MEAAKITARLLSPFLYQDGPGQTPLLQNKSFTLFFTTLMARPRAGLAGLTKIFVGTVTSHVRGNNAKARAFDLLCLKLMDAIFLYFSWRVV